MKFDGHNVSDLSAYRVGNNIRRVDHEASDLACAEMQAATTALIEAHKSGDWFAEQRAVDRCDAARIKLVELMRCAL